MTSAPDEMSDTKPSQLGAIQRRTYYFEDASKDMEYALILPTGYKQDKKTPLVVLLHGDNRVRKYGVAMVPLCFSN